MKKGVSAGRTVPETKTGHYRLTDYQKVLKDIVSGGVSVVVTLPYTWASQNLRVLSPEALRLVDLKVAPDKAFPEPSTFVVERGGKKYRWLES